MKLSDAKHYRAKAKKCRDAAASAEDSAARVSLVSKKKPGRRRRSPGFCSARSQRQARGNRAVP